MLHFHAVRELKSWAPMYVMVLNTGHDGRKEVFVYKKVPYLFQYTYRTVSAPTQILSIVFIVWRDRPPRPFITDGPDKKVYPKFCDFLTPLDLMMTLICVNHISFQSTHQDEHFVGLLVNVWWLLTKKMFFMHMPLHFPHFWATPTGMPKVVLHCCMNIHCLPQFTFKTAFVGS